ncbi:hypothetical protein SAURM35S_00469 [Streptomyces aurantiogriseus]
MRPDLGLWGSSAVAADVSSGEAGAEVSSDEATAGVPSAALLASGRTARPCALTPSPSSACPAEFHIRADGERNTTCPLPSTASMLPAAPARTRSPSTSIEYFSDASAGSFAAWSVSTSSTCRKPSTVAVRIRFTSGRTSS